VSSIGEGSFRLKRTSWCTRRYNHIKRWALYRDWVLLLTSCAKQKNNIDTLQLQHIVYRNRDDNFWIEIGLSCRNTGSTADSAPSQLLPFQCVHSRQCIIMFDECINPAENEAPGYHQKMTLSFGKAFSRHTSSSSCFVVPSTYMDNVGSQSVSSSVKPIQTVVTATEITSNIGTYGFEVSHNICQLG
jgi:hypothetical protein